jgi:hypothetical protein
MGRNLMLIHQGQNQSQRITQLNAMAITQMRSLLALDDTRKRLETKHDWEAAHAGMAEPSPGGESERLTLGQWPRYLDVTFRNKSWTGAATR